MSRLLVRQRPKGFWYHLFDAVNATEMCAPHHSRSCKPEAHRPHAPEAPPAPPKGGPVCGRPDLFKQKLPGATCVKSCNAMEHIWGHVLCQPCHNVPKDQDPRYPWNTAAVAKYGPKGKRRLAVETNRSLPGAPRGGGGHAPPPPHMNTREVL